MEKNKKTERLLRITFVFYIIFLLKMIVFKYYHPWELFSSTRDVRRSLNIYPYRGAFRSRITLNDVLGNIIAFIPLGVYYKLFDRERSFFKGVLIFIAISFSFEAIQYAFGIGASDITDLINNTLGGMIGILGLMILDKLFKNRAKVDSLIGILASIAMVLVSILVGLLYLING